jgi:Undecaprenyl-phosphate glucose phosphotransferase
LRLRLCGHERWFEQGAMTAARTKLAEVALGSSPRNAVSPVILIGLWRLAEMVLFAAVGFGTYAAYVQPQIGWQAAYLTLIPLIAFAGTMMLQGFRTYTLSALRRPVVQVPRLVAAWGLTFLIVFAAVFFFRLEGMFSRLFMLVWFTAGSGVTIAGRLSLAAAMRSLTRRSLLDRRVVIVGGGEPAVSLLEQLSHMPETDLRITGVFDDRNDDRSSDMVAGYPKLGTVDDLLAYARHARVDLVIFALPVTAEARILHMLRKLWVLPVDIRLAAHTQQLRFRARNYSFVGNVPFFDMADRPMADWDVVQKWLFDKIVGSLMLITLAPVMLMVALAVKLTSRGPALFRQKRYGFNNDLIEVFKFRSMYMDQSDAGAAKLVTKDDPRVTRVGRFIRKTSLDELPQLFNVVFKGNLSLIGPRPHALQAKAENRLYDQVVDGYFARHKVKPGITGWAQVNGWRGETDTEEKIQRRVDHDLSYIENWSLGLDLKILLMTPFSLLKSENAY